ncbi:DUF4926 domain-containing protein [Aphanothece hegewaldii CCALA 016]|uniref:DUF4926 domain-containing protein n=1 Tax=Aphanothece hegewaldii CCALA 016 TaxID=2107694 RepID=A0A2T1LTK2_9CHRO|nr:DUF4926 domain-containing protein [Aphanothece hegewaldii]PSF33872.1 DUF4926 domain-containing protein [Aphanothece hegewaldii CCALA 016]
MTQIKLHDTVALVEDTKTHRFMTSIEIILRRGQVGTVVEEYKDGEAFEVEFSDDRGQTYALLTVKSEKLIPLFYDLAELNVR